MPVCPLEGIACNGHGTACFLLHTHLTLQRVYGEPQCSLGVCFLGASELPLRHHALTEGGAFSALQFGTLASCERIAVPFFGHRDFSSQRECALAHVTGKPRTRGARCLRRGASGMRGIACRLGGIDTGLRTGCLCAQCA